MVPRLRPSLPGPWGVSAWTWGFLLALLLGACPARAAVPQVGFTQPEVAGVRASVVTVDLNSAFISVRPVRAWEGYATFAQMVRRERPVAAINGTFFDPGSATILGHLVWDGRLLQGGIFRHALAIDRNFQALLLSGPEADWSRYLFALSAGPVLVRDGVARVDPWAEGFSDPRLLRPARRSAAGITARNKLLLVTVSRPITLSHLARVMAGLGARQAINLDGGGSSALYYQGRFITRPTRKMTNLIVVHYRPAPLTRVELAEEADRPPQAGKP